MGVGQRNVSPGMGGVGLVATHTQRRLACAKPVTDATESTRCSMRVNPAASSPAWYSLNHKRRPNLEMVWRKGAIEWRALCKILQGAELGFGYGDVQGCGFR